MFLCTYLTYLICVVWFVPVVVNVMFMKCVVSTWHIVGGMCRLGFSSHPSIHPSINPIVCHNFCFNIKHFITPTTQYGT